MSLGDAIRGGNPPLKGTEEGKEAGKGDGRPSLETFRLSLLERISKKLEIQNTELTQSIEQERKKRVEAECMHIMDFLLESHMDIQHNHHTNRQIEATFKGGITNEN
jgi:hypothetical protein